MARFAVLNENRDFLRLYKRGKSLVHPVLVTYLQKNRQGVTRVGITASKKVGGAVQRNRAKRLIRAAWRENGALVPPGYDIVFVARTRTVGCRMRQVSKAMAEQLKKLVPQKEVGAT
ncbi:MAG: ribonuclease P protein component [Angelakisella sp.]